jgi:DNA repair exonuclease SbcCD ATPase subunit
MQTSPESESMKLARKIITLLLGSGSGSAGLQVMNQSSPVIAALIEKARAVDKVDQEFVVQAWRAKLETAERDLSQAKWALVDARVTAERELAEARNEAKDWHSIYRGEEDRANSIRGHLSEAEADLAQAEADLADARRQLGEAKMDHHGPDRGRRARTPAESVEFVNSDHPCCLPIGDVCQITEELAERGRQIEALRERLEAAEKVISTAQVELRNMMTRGPTWEHRRVAGEMFFKVASALAANATTAPPEEKP